MKFFADVVNLFLFSEIDNCLNHTCENGASCLDGIESYTCVCADGWEGPFCQRSNYALVIVFLRRREGKTLPTVVNMCIESALDGEQKNLGGN